MSSNEQQVRERAYHIWEGEGRGFGQAVEHWLRAEAEFRAMDEATVKARSVARSSAKAESAKSPAKTLKPRSSRSASVAATAVAAKAEVKSASVKKPSAAKPAASRAKPSSRGNAAASVVLH